MPWHAYKAWLPGVGSIHESYFPGDFTPFELPAGSLEFRRGIFPLLKKLLPLEQFVGKT